MQKLDFPRDFIFGTSSSAYQVETAVDHDWKGVKAKDGHTFNRTTDHELRVDEDVEIIAGLAPSYRMSLMWDKLQPGPFAKLDPAAVAFYHSLLQKLRDRNVSIMMVIHHFVNPSWFSSNGGWNLSKNIDAWVDFASRIVDEFGQYVAFWNTFNEPNLYTSMGYLLGEFPPFRKNIVAANRVVRNIAAAHNKAYDYIKQKFPTHPVGISHNCAVFRALNFAGIPVAQMTDRWYMEFIPDHFTKSDFIGLSYYARLSFDPMPITQLNTPAKIKKLGLRHDDIWEYYPEGLAECIVRYSKKYGKPVIITENGVSTSDDKFRVAAIRDYMRVMHTCISNKIDIRGYYHWSTWDNFEWTLGPSYRFGLYEVDFATMERRRKESADLYAKLAYTKSIDVD
jgi:beta-glucosidase